MCYINFNVASHITACLLPTGCSGCYQIIESTYNITLQAHNNFTANYEHFQNLTQMGVSQAVEVIRSMLEERRQLAVRTAATERNVTSQLSVIQTQTIRIQHSSDMFEPILSAVANTTQEVTTSHNNNVMNITKLDMLVTTISSIISNNISVLLNQAEVAYNESVVKVRTFACKCSDYVYCSRVVCVSDKLEWGSL